MRWRKGHENLDLCKSIHSNFARVAFEKGHPEDAGKYDKIVALF